MVCAAYARFYRGAAFAAGALGKNTSLYCALESRHKSPARSFQYKSVFRAAQTKKIAGVPPAEQVGWFECVGARARRRGWLVLGYGVVPGLRDCAPSHLRVGLGSFVVMLHMKLRSLV